MQIPDEDGIYLVRPLFSFCPPLSLQLYRDTVKASLAALQPHMFTSTGNSRQWSSRSVLPLRPSHRVPVLQLHLTGDKRHRAPLPRFLVPHLMKTSLPTDTPVLHLLPSRSRILPYSAIRTASRRRPPGPTPPLNHLIKICSLLPL
jgi:hypothetical protein